jgi:hypothetical protein
MLASRTWNAISCNNFAPYPNLIVVVVARTYRRGEPYCGGAAREISVGLEPVAAAPAILGPLHTPPTPVRGDWGLKITDGLEKELRAEIAALRDGLKATAAKLHERLARLPIVKEFQPDTVYYAGRTLRDRAIDVMS